MTVSHEAPPCPACAARENTLTEAHAGYDLRTCEQCGLCFADPMRPGDSAYYAQHIVYHATDPGTLRNHYISARRSANRRLLGMVPPGGRTLDVGCGFGAFVAFATELGFDAYGLDFNSDQIFAGRETFGLGDRLIVGRVEDSANCLQRAAPFDLVTLFEVIEHVAEPAGLIEEVRGLLCPGGVLALSCPNEARWQPTGRIFVDYPPHHLTRWRPGTLRALLERRGFAHIETRIESSFRDLIWVTYSNRSAQSKMARAKLGLLPTASARPTGGGRLQAGRRKLLFALDRLLRIMCLPADLGLRALGVGTLSMRMMVRKV